MTQRPGRIVILNGVPRSGKTSIATALQANGRWIGFGVDAVMGMTPEHLQPGNGLRPGGERPDLEPFVRQSYAALFDSLAGFSRHGLDVVSDLGLHGDYATPFDPATLMRDRLVSLPLLFVGVRCPIAVIMDRRNADTSGRYAAGDTVPPPVARWQAAVHEGRAYALEVDSSVMSPDACAAAIMVALPK